MGQTDCSWLMGKVVTHLDNMTQAKAMAHAFAEKADAEREAFKSFLTRLVNEQPSSLNEPWVVHHCINTLGWGKAEFEARGLDPWAKGGR